MDHWSSTMMALFSVSKFRQMKRKETEHTQSEVRKQHVSEKHPLAKQKIAVARYESKINENKKRRNNLQFCINMCEQNDSHVGFMDCHHPLCRG